jgi:uncharacterized YigZ family protein
LDTQFTYQTIINTGISEFKDRGSKFLGYVFPIENVEDFKMHLKSIKELHPKATHHCFAYRLGADKNIFRASDDGEPSSSAGKPILGAIDSAELTNVLAIVVRYYGGTMLGVPGLINAYKTTAKEALIATEKIVLEKTETFELEFDYQLTSIVNQALQKLNALHQSTENLLFCKKMVKIPYSQVANAMDIFGKMHNLVFRKLMNDA